MKKLLALLPLLFTLSCAGPGGGAAAGGGQAQGPAQANQAEALNKAMSPGINYGNVFEANPPEGWGLAAKETDFALIARAGFKGLRLPVRWSAKASPSPPYTIDAMFFNKVDRMVYAAMRSGMIVVLNMHHYDELFKEPGAHKERFLKMWEQIAAHYARHPKTLIFEILNEPHDKLDVGLWNGLYPQALAVIRRTNPNRTVMIGTAKYGGAEGLEGLIPPSNDKNVIVTFHHYSPFQFTHQGADWAGAESKSWLGKTWGSSPAEVAQISEDFNKARAFARRYKLPVNLGEFGAYSKADMDSRVRWTAAMADTSNRYGFSHFYWEFKSGFGIYDEKTGKWNEALKAAALR